MRLGTVIVSLLFATSLAIVFFALSGNAENISSEATKPLMIVPSFRRTRNPIRDRYFLKPGLCAQNYYLNGTKPGFKFYRFHKKSGECFRIDEKGPCSRNMMFYRVGNTDFGECDCDHNKRCGRPLLYWEQTDSCFYVNTQGPCREGQWLVYGLTKKPVCQKNICHRLERDSPSNHRARKFWIAINGQCMKTRTKGFCPSPRQVMFFKEGEAYPQCVNEEEATVCNQMGRISRPCWAGQKFDSKEKCRDTYGLWGSEDDH